MYVDGRRFRARTERRREGRTSARTMELTVEMRREGRRCAGRRTAARTARAGGCVAVAERMAYTGECTPSTSVGGTKNIMMASTWAEVCSSTAEGSSSAKRSSSTTATATTPSRTESTSAPEETTPTRSEVTASGTAAAVYEEGRLRPEPRFVRAGG